MVTTLFLLPRAGAQNSGMRVMSPAKVHSLYGVEIRSSGCIDGNPEAAADR